MTLKDQEVERPVGRASEQRAYPRQPVRLSAVFTLSRGGVRHQCEIRDFCPGGLLLVYDPADDPGYMPLAGDVIELQATPRTVTGAKVVTFTARVVRTDGRSAGVALVNPEAASVHAMQAFASEQVKDDDIEDSYARDVAPLSTTSAQGIIAAYRKVLTHALTQIIKAFVSNADERFIELAKNAAGMSAQDNYISAKSSIKVASQYITQRFHDTVSSRIQNIGRPQGRQSKQSSTGEGLTLTLMEHDTLEDWLAISDVVDHVESRHQIVLSEIERRLSYLHQAPINRETNPLGPSVLAQAFQEAIAPLGLDHSIKQVCFTLFKEVLGGYLPQLYGELNSLLIRSGVLPYLKPEIVRQPGSPASMKMNIDDADGESTAVKANGGSPEAGDDAHGGNDGRGATGPGYTGQGSSGSGQDLYRIVRNLRGLQQNFQHGPVSGGLSQVPGAYQGSGAHMPQAVYDKEEILTALSRMQTTASGAADDLPQGMDFQSRVMSVLEAQSPGEEKHLGERESGIVDVAGSLFDSMLQDMLVARSVRGWLHRLEIPILKLAIVDDTLFLDRAHVARQVVNRITQLELYGEGDDNSQNAIQRKVAGLIDRIVKQVDTDPDVFKSVLRELDLLIQIQNEAYADNLHEAVAQCEKEQDIATDVPYDEGEQDWDRRDEWIKRARRLRVGSWLLLESDRGSQQRLRLAWISKNEDRYVFVNLRGLREAVLAVADLARRLRDGTAILLDNADESAIDRAQYTMLQTLHRKLLHESTHDQLTGLINRREFDRRFREAVNDVCSGGDAFSLCYMDIDQFSVINSTCGYDAGDRLLVDVSELIRDTMSKNAMVARMGSDEFAILLEKVPVREAMKIVESLIDAMRSYRFNWQDKRFSVSFSTGMVQVDEQQGDPAELLQAAESSCRAARERGVNNIQIYRADDTLLSNRNHTAQWLSRIDKALDEGVVDLRCQRIMPLQGEGLGGPLHAEVLMSLINENGEHVSPQEFIVAAEHYHRMPAIDRLVVRSMFQWMVAHSAELKAFGGFAINLSGRSLSDENFLDFVLKEAEDTKVPMDRVCFEVTETAGISNLSDATEFILQMKKTGCHFSLDDFGSGFSSYTYLKNLPVDFLKIDGAFVKEMDKSPSDFAVVKSISEIGHFMGKKIIAECVETKAVLDQLRDIGVDFAQGYIVDMPQPLVD